MVSRFKREQNETIYRIYISDILKGLSGAKERYYDLINPKIETRTPEEIIDHIKTGLNRLNEDG